MIIICYCISFPYDIECTDCVPRFGCYVFCIIFLFHLFTAREIVYVFSPFILFVLVVLFFNYLFYAGQLLIHMFFFVIC